MGLGKTLQFITTILAKRPRRVLIMCPPAVIGVWVGEISKWWLDGQILVDPQSIPKKGMRKTAAAEIRKNALGQEHDGEFNVRTLRRDDEFKKLNTNDKAN